MNNTPKKKPLIPTWLKIIALVGFYGYAAYYSREMKKHLVAGDSRGITASQESNQTPIALEKLSLGEDHSVGVIKIAFIHCAILGANFSDNPFVLRKPDTDSPMALKCQLQKKDTYACSFRSDTEFSNSQGNESLGLFTLGKGPYPGVTLLSSANSLETIQIKNKRAIYQNPAIADWGAIAKMCVGEIK